MSINIAVVPYLYQAFKDKLIAKRDVIKLYYWSFLIIPVPYMLSLLIPNSLLLFILGSDFIDSLYSLYSFVFNYSLAIPYLILVVYLFYKGETKRIIFCSVVSVVSYLLSLIILSNYNLSFMPLEFLFGSLLILPFLYYNIKKVD